MVDNEDYELLKKFKWHLQSGGYARSCNKGNAVYMHRLVLGLSKDSKSLADHINGNKLDNRRCNLRISDRTGNARNCSISKNNKCGYKGVSEIVGRNRWQANIVVNREQIYLGCFKTPQDASEAYKVASLKYHGEFSRV